MKIRVARKPADAYQHGNLREALVQAAMKLLSEGGVEDLSLRAAAQLAGVSHAAPYRHFKDKNALVAAVAEQGFRLLTAALRAGEQAAAGGTVRERLRGQGQGYVKFAIENPGYLGIIFGGVLDGKLTTPELQAAGKEAYHALRDLVAEGITRGVDGAWAVPSVEQPGGGAANPRSVRPGHDRGPGGHGHAVAGRGHRPPLMRRRQPRHVREAPDRRGRTAPRRCGFPWVERHGVPG
jgi:AcrR family transcriptional regulator